MRAILSLITVVALPLLLGTSGSPLDASTASPRPLISKVSSTENSKMSSSPTKKHSTPIQEKITVSKRKIRRQKSKSTQFPSKEHREIEDIPIETDQNITVQLVLRSIFLFMVFIPIILTSGLAYISTFFRTYIWYRMITMAITAGGAVSNSSSYCHQLLSCYNYRSSIYI